MNEFQGDKDNTALLKEAVFLLALIEDNATRDNTIVIPLEAWYRWTRDFREMMYKEAVARGLVEDASGSSKQTV